MATRASYRRQNLYYYDTVLSPALGSSLWEDCPLPAIMSNPTIGVVSDWQFMNVTPATSVIPGWTTTIATSGTVTNDATLGLKVDAGAVTANQGINIQQISTRYKIQTNKPVWFEARFRTSGFSATPRVQFLVGIAAASTALITAGAVGTQEKVAFAGVTTTGVILANTTLASTATTGTGFTFADTTVYKVGFKASSTSVAFYVNDALTATLTTNIPVGFMAPSITVQAHGTVTPAMTFERLTCVGLF